MSLSFFNCHRMYFLICSSFRPAVLTQYSRVRECLPQYRFFSSGCLSKILMALLPFRNPTASETECFGGIRSTKCTWSICTFPSIISKSLHWLRSRIVSLTDFPVSPFRIRNRYFGHHAKLYLHSRTACADFLKSLIECLILIFRVTRLKLEEVFDFYNLTLNHYGTPISTAGTINMADGLR
jgi:hypothetical protein